MEGLPSEEPQIENKPVKEANVAVRPEEEQVKAKAAVALIDAHHSGNLASVLNPTEKAKVEDKPVAEAKREGLPTEEPQIENTAVKETNLAVRPEEEQVKAKAAEGLIEAHRSGNLASVSNPTEKAKVEDKPVEEAKMEGLPSEEPQIENIPVKEANVAVRPEEEQVKAKTAVALIDAHHSGNLASVLNP